MHGIALSLDLLHLKSFSFLNKPNKTFQPLCRIGYGSNFGGYRIGCVRRRYKNGVVKARRGESPSPYEVLGISPSATTIEIKRAYRRLALKYHPDVNKEPNAQQNFMKIKHAYNTLLNAKSRKKYDSGSGTPDYSYSTANRKRSRTTEEEDFYGLDDFLRDLEDEFRNWEATAASQGKPKSLWEELADIGEEFVEFLEKGLNINDADADIENDNQRSQKSKVTDGPDDHGSSIQGSIDEIEAALAQLKREMGL